MRTKGIETDQFMHIHGRAEWARTISPSTHTSRTRTSVQLYLLRDGTIQVTHHTYTFILVYIYLGIVSDYGNIVGYTPLSSLSSLTVLMYRLLRSLWRGPLYVSSLNRSLASIERLLRRWAGPFPCALGRPLLWIARNVQIVGWRSPAGVWMVSPPRLS